MFSDATCPAALLPGAWLHAKEGMLMNGATGGKAISPKPRAMTAPTMGLSTTPLNT
jgi:hypothetical protein